MIRLNLNCFQSHQGTGKTHNNSLKSLSVFKRFFRFDHKGKMSDIGSDTEAPKTVSITFKFFLISIRAESY